MLTAIVSLVTFLYLLITGYVIIQQNPKRLVNISLAVGVFIVGLWLIGVAGLTTALGNNIWYGRAIFAAGLTSVQVLALFVLIFADSEHKRIRYFNIKFFLYVGLAFLTVIMLTPFVLKGVAPGKPGALPSPDIGLLYPVYVLWIILLGAIIVAQLVHILKHSDNRLHNQAQVILLGLFLFAAIGVTTNVILPEVLHSTEPAKLTPLSAAILGFSLSYAIVKHGLLNIRLIVARSAAYLLLVFTLIGIYTIVVFGLANRFFREDSVFTRQVLPIVAALFVAATAPFFKRLFDRVTNQVFYRDAYDPQVFLDRLNKTLVGNIELDILLPQTTEVIQDNLKCEICLIGVRKTDASPFRIIGSTGPSFKALDMQFVSKELAHIGQKILVTDDLDSSHARLKQMLHKDNVSIICSLSNYEPDQPATAYMILGAKKSGNIYSKQDLRIIEIISDELVIAIQNALRFEEIQGFAVTLQRRIKEATANLKRSNEKLKELDEAKDDFISMASHQLRTPLTSVKGYLSIILEGDTDSLSKQQREMLTQAYFSSQRMVYIIADLLNVSRLRTGKFIIDASPSDLSEVVAGEVEQLVDLAKARSIKVAFNPPKDFPKLMLDEMKIRQIIMNFLDNAIYYTKSGGHIKINLTYDDRIVELRVQDDGIGVPKHEQHHLFTKFYRAANARQIRPDGTGLGLFMAKKVIIAQGGSLIFESKEGKGSTFGFTFSRAKLDVPKQP